MRVDVHNNVYNFPMWVPPLMRPYFMDHAPAYFLRSFCGSCTAIAAFATTLASWA